MQLPATKFNVGLGHTLKSLSFSTVIYGFRYENKRIDFFFYICIGCDSVNCLIFGIKYFALIFKKDYL